MRTLLILAAACLSGIASAAILNPNPKSYDLAFTYHTANPSPASVDKDIVYDLRVTNNGPDPATSAFVIAPLPVGTTYVWKSSNCNFGSGAFHCGGSNIPVGQTLTFYIVVRPSAPGTVQSTASVDVALGDGDPNYANNSTSLTTTVNASPPPTPRPRYRLYSPVTKEHHFTTDLNEYNTLGALVGTWVQEGTVGKVLDNPGAFGGVTAVPYYRLYNGPTQWHHWTTDANEYYTLAGYAGWYAEGVDGWILPAAAAGTTQLYRLNYPAIPGLHHWTIDANEYSTLVASYGWVGEGGTGFVVQ